MVKIDGLVALIMAVPAAARREPDLNAAILARGGLP